MTVADEPRGNTDEPLPDHESELVRAKHWAKERVIARIAGRVQGVNFRASAAHEARRRGLTGWVRNEPDGSVTIDVEGEPAALDAFLAWCAKGPPRSNVTAVETTTAAPDGYRQFTIRR